MHIVVSLKKDKIVSIVEKDNYCLLQLNSEITGFFYYSYFIQKQICL